MTTTEFSASAAGGVGRLRVAVCVGTIAAVLPYLVLKVAWLCGARAGVRGDAMDGTAMRVANSATLLMDGAAALLALALVRPWGRRIPAAPLVFPMWAATGFLAPVLVIAPLSGVVEAFAGSGPDSGSGSSAADGLAGWVYLVVYGGFGAQCLGLLTGFVFYARDRWAAVFRLRPTALAALPGAGAYRVVVTAVAAFSAVPCGIHVYWAGGGSGMYPGNHWSAAVRLVTEGAFGLLPLAGVAALVSLVWRRDERPAGGLVAAAWLGTGALFCWGLWWLLAASFTTPMQPGADMRGLALTGALGMLAGAVLATALMLLVVTAVAVGQAEAAAVVPVTAVPVAVAGAGAAESAPARTVGATAVG